VISSKDAVRNSKGNICPFCMSDHSKKFNKNRHMQQDHCPVLNINKKRLITIKRLDPGIPHMLSSIDKELEA
jgi:hypothetical protein